MAAVRDKQRREDAQVAELINRGIPAAPVRTGTDGGMNQTFMAAVRSHGGPGANIRTAAGTIPAHVNPPGEAAPESTTGSTMSLASTESKPAAAPRSVQVASAGPSGGSGGIGSFFGNLFGSKSESEPAAPRAAEAAKPKSNPPAAARPPQVAAAARPKQSEPPPSPPKAATGAIKPQTRQASTEPESSPASPEPKPANTTTLLSGAAPTMPSGGFDNRFGAWR